MTLVFLEQEHKYYSLNELFTDTKTDYLSLDDFISTHGEIERYEPKEMLSVTTFIGQFYDHFDADLIVDKMMASSEGKNLEGDPIYTSKNTDYQGCTRQM